MCFFFCRVPVILESYMSSLSSRGGGGVGCANPRDPPMSSLVLNRILVIIYVTLISNFVEFFLLGNGEGDVMYAEEILQPHLKAFPKVSCSSRSYKKVEKSQKKYSDRMLGLV